VIPVPPGVRVLIATRPVDFRKGADSLAALAKETLGQDPFSCRAGSRYSLVVRFSSNSRKRWTSSRRPLFGCGQ